MKRVWTETGENFIRSAYADPQAQPRHGDYDQDATRAHIAREIDGLTWREPSGSFPLTPGMALQKLVEDFRIPNVSAVAINGGVPMPDGPERAYYSLYGIEANYTNGRIRMYVLDAGTILVPVAIDEDVPEPAI